MDPLSRVAWSATRASSSEAISSTRNASAEGDCGKPLSRTAATTGSPKVDLRMLSTI